MISWLGRNNVGLKQLQEFNARLRSMNGPELGIPVAFASHFRNKYLLTGRDFNDPERIAKNDPEFVLRMIAEIERLQSQGLQYMAPGIMIWVHSFRAARELSLRPYGRDMWHELARGFPHVEKAAVEVELATGFQVDFAGYNQVPTVLSPHASN